MKFKDMPYERIDLEETKNRLVPLLESFEKASSGKEQFEIHQAFTEIYAHYLTMADLSYVRYTLNTEDSFYQEERDYYDENSPYFQKLMTDFYKIMIKSPYRAELEEIMGSLAFENAEIQLKAFDERIIPFMQEENKLCTTYSKLIASASFEFDGKTLNLPMLGFYMEHEDREIRRAAYKKRTEFFVEHSSELDEIYDKLVKLRTQMAKALNLENYVPLGYLRMKRNDYDAQKVAAFRKQVKEDLVPLCNAINDKRREHLGLDKLSFIDEPLFYPEGNPKPMGTPEEIFENGKKMYSELSPETSEFFKFMLDNELFDCLSKKGKASGGYQITLQDFKSPFVFANFNGTSGDIDVLTHECGHAFEAYVTRNFPILEHLDIGMETAEIHSMSMEFFTGSWMPLFFYENSDKYLYMHLASALLFLPYGCMVDEFQHLVYENPDMTPDQRKEVWQNLEKVYKPHLNYEDDPFFGKGRAWQRQSHIYEAPFYYIDYCLAQFCALQYKIKSVENFPEAWDSYLNLVGKGAKLKFTKLIEEAGLNSPFEEGSVKKLAEKVSILLNQYEDSIV